MKIYFAGSIRGGRDDAALYADLISRLRTFGEVLTEHVGDLALTRAGDDGPNDQYIHDRDMAWLADCDLLVAEVTAPSLGVGYELGRAVEMGKPVLCLYRPSPNSPLSAMVAGSPGIRTESYSSLDEAMKLFELFLNLQSRASNSPAARQSSSRATGHAGHGKAGSNG
jgi:nucleoside 2-deoxyribosyltransferase